MGHEGRQALSQGVAPARSLQPAMDAAGTSQVDPDEAEMERIRRRILQEAEEAFKLEIRKLRGDGVGTDSRSYHSASSGGDQAGSQGAQGGRPGLGTAGTPGGGDRIGMASMSTPAAGDRGGAGQGATPGHGPAGMATPPGLDGRLHGGFLGGPQNGIQDSLKSHELPPLPVPGADGASLAFGDWMALAGPQMGDIGLNSRDWWLYVRHQVELLYERWLVSTPVERLRLRPVEGDIPGEFQRVEQRGVSMLLAAAPETVKRDLVATRTLSSTGILFRFYTVFQPGGGSEKAALLRQITEPKIGSSVADLLTGLRSWRRLLGRANELRLALPDPAVLSGILGRMADALGRAGGGQAEELALSTNAKVFTTSAAGNPVVKALQVPITEPGSTPVVVSGTENKAPCRYWRSDEGCRRGQACTFRHDQERGRCWNCGSQAHMKKDCPHKVKDSAPKTPKTAKIKGKEKDTPEKKPMAVPGEAVVKDVTQENFKVNGKDENPVKGENPKEPSRSLETTGDVASELIKEAAGLLKSLRSVKSMKLMQVTVDPDSELGRWALLDGGATHALRRARPDELESLVEVQVELASGSTTLYRVRDHQTLLSLGEVEPILPLHMLVSKGYRVTWKADGCRITHPTYGQVLEADIAEVNSDPHLRKLDMAAWRRHVRQQHVPFRKDCRFCLESMGTSQPHRRSNNASSAFTMSVDVMGPYCIGKDLGTGKSCRYAMVAVVPIPVVKDLPGAAAVPEVKDEELEEVPEMPELEEEVELVPEEQVQAMNEKADIDRFAAPMDVQNITLMEPVQSRKVDHLVASPNYMLDFASLGSTSCVSTLTGSDRSCTQRSASGVTHARWSKL
eukprot:s319_g19.t1